MGESDCALPSRGRRGRRGLFVRRRDDYTPPAHYGQVVIHRYEYIYIYIYIYIHIYTSRCVDVYLDSIHICVYAYQSLFYHMAKQTDERERGDDCVCVCVCVCACGVGVCAPQYTPPLRRIQ